LFAEGVGFPGDVFEVGFAGGGDEMESPLEDLGEAGAHLTEER
jgi:hypothetical protein